MTFYIQCLLFHQWTPWRRMAGLNVEYRECERCKKYQQRPTRSV